GAEAILLGNPVPDRPCRCFPDDQTVIHASRCKCRSIRAEGDGFPALARRLKCSDKLANGDFPELDLAVLAARGEGLAIRTEGQSATPPAMSSEPLHVDQLGTAGNVPCPDLAVGRGEVLAIGTDRYGSDEILVALERQPLLAAGEVPDFNQPVVSTRDQSP